MSVITISDCDTHYRYYGNRSFCYEYIKDYARYCVHVCSCALCSARALDDANVAIKLKPDWPKGHFRRGKALVGLEVRDVCCLWC